MDMIEISPPPRPLPRPHPGEYFEDWCDRLQVDRQALRESRMLLHTLAGHYSRTAPAGD